MERGWRSVAVAKRATGDLSAADFCCPRRNFRRSWKFKALQGLEKVGVKQTGWWELAVLSSLWDTSGSGGTPCRHRSSRRVCSITKNPEELSSRQRKRQVKLLSTKDCFSAWRCWGLDVALHLARGGYSGRKAGKAKAKGSFPSALHILSSRIRAAQVNPCRDHPGTHCQQHALGSCAAGGGRRPCRLHGSAHTRSGR